MDLCRQEQGYLERPDASCHFVNVMASILGCDHSQQRLGVGGGGRRGQAHLPMDHFAWAPLGLALHTRGSFLVSDVASFMVDKMRGEERALRGEMSS